MADAADPGAWHAWFDGSAVPNPGRIGLGGLLQAPDGQRWTISVACGTGNSNDAEYLALTVTLQQALALKPDALVVYGDSRIVIDDMLGSQPPVAVLQVHRLRAQALVAQFPAIRLGWIPRAKNSVADALARVSQISATGCSIPDLSIVIPSPSV